MRRVMTLRRGRGWVGYCNGEEVAGMGIGMVIGPRDIDDDGERRDYPRMLCSSCQWGIRKRSRLQSTQPTNVWDTCALM